SWCSTIYKACSNISAASGSSDPRSIINCFLCEPHDLEKPDLGRLAHSLALHLPSGERPSSFCDSQGHMTVCTTAHRSHISLWVACKGRYTLLHTSSLLHTS